MVRGALDSNARATSELATWQRIHVDFAGPFNGQMFLLVVHVDAKSKWIEVFPMPSTTCTASATIRAPRFLFATHSLPEVIVSENGPQVCCSENKGLPEVKMEFVIAYPRLTTQPPMVKSSEPKEPSKSQ